MAYVAVNSVITTCLLSRRGLGGGGGLSGSYPSTCTFTPALSVSLETVETRAFVAPCLIPTEVRGRSGVQLRFRMAYDTAIRPARSPKYAAVSKVTVTQMLCFTIRV